MTEQTDLVIVGGGLNGPVLALAAAQAGLSAAIIDPVPDAAMQAEGFNGKSYALALASQRLLRALGVWDALAEHAQPMQEIKVSDGRAGEGPSPFLLHFDAGEIEEGPMGYMVEDRHLRRVLADAVHATPRITRIEDSVQGAFAQNGLQIVQMASGTERSGKVLIGADGRRSGVAERAGITRTGWEYGQTALVCAIAHEKPHHGIAHQFFMPQGPLAILPLTGNRCSIVWTESHAMAAKIHALSDADYLAVLRPRFGDFLGDISLAGARYTYPLNLTLAEAFVAERVALVGDAAHGVHPIAGQGLNAGLRDIAALAQVLGEARQRGEDIGSAPVLERYAQWRRFDVATLALATDGFNKLFSNDNPLLRAARDLGMGVVNAVPALRRGFIREAAGLTGDVPKLMQ